MNEKKNTTVLLPGLGAQFLFLQNQTDIPDKKILIIGSGCLPVAEKMIAAGASKVEIIIDDEELMFIDRLQQPESDLIRIRYMDYTNTDFRDTGFDIIYAQASVSTKKHSKILKEIQNLLNPGGIICMGEVVKLEEETPTSINDVWERSNLQPLSIENLREIYEKSGYEILEQKDLSYTLVLVYEQNKQEMEKKLNLMSDEELRAYKKDISRYKHEANMYLRLGGDKYTGYVVFILRKQAQ